MRKILVTGGAGFIGSCLAEKLIQDPENFVIIFDNLSTGFSNKLPDSKQKNWRFVKGDCNNYRDIAEVMLAYHFDFVFHYAAVVGVQRTQANPCHVLNDLEGFRNILNISKSTSIKRIFFASSSEVYGEPVSFPQNEITTPLNSRVPYAVVKNVGEAFLRSYHKEYDLQYTIFRFFNTYGPKQSKDFVISRFIDMAIHNKPITIYGDGSQTRTFCYIDDNIDACYRAAEDNLFINEVVNIGNDNETSVLDLAKTIIKLTNSKSEIVHLPPLKEGDMSRRLPDITNMKTLLNRPLTSLETGINNILHHPLWQ
ncbi:MAG: NAD-dependent epimerase/dehydratase family protein [Bacteroidales bacterium]|nr:NAD-dependent epimerase/dehydratase family protein [Bacteroidales bacterium]